MNSPHFAQNLRVAEFAVLQRAHAGPDGAWGRVRVTGRISSVAVVAPVRAGDAGDGMALGVTAGSGPAGWAGERALGALSSLPASFQSRKNPQFVQNWTPATTGSPHDSQTAGAMTISRQ